MARYDRGWIKIYRSVVEEDIGQRGNFTLGIFVRLLRMANWREGSATFGSERVELKRGQLVTGLRELSPNFEEDPYLHRVRNALAYLEKRGTITQSSTNQGRLITVCNWEDYQIENNIEDNSTASEPQAERKQSASRAQLNEEYKNIRKKEEKENTCADAVANAPATQTEDVATLPVPKKSKFSPTTREKMRSFLNTYAKDYKTKYGGVPEGIRGNKALLGKIGHWIEHVSEVRANSLVQVYLQIDHRQINESYHDLWNFFRNMNRIGVALDTGKDASQIDWEKVFGAA